MVASPWPEAAAIELRRLGLLRPWASRRPLAAAVAAGLLEAFGDDRWRDLCSAAVLDRLRSAAPPQGVSGRRRPRYAALAAGGVVECVFGLGHDDAGDRAAPTATAERLAGLVAALRDRGYVEGPSAAAPLLAALGRPAPEDGASTYCSRPAGMRFSPPAGPERTVDVVVRIVANADGRQGTAAAAGLLDGLRHAALCAYVGHLRYGLGPDFDAADPAGLGATVAAEARVRGERVEETLDRWLAAGSIRIGRTNGGRVVLSHRNLVPGSASARVAHWVARRADGGLPATAAVAGSRRDYRIWALLACRSARLFPTLAAVVAPAAVCLLGVRDMVGLGEWRALPWILDGLCAGGDWSELSGVVGGHGYGDRLVVAGWEDDPYVP